MIIKEQVQSEQTCAVCEVQLYYYLFLLNSRDNRDFLLLCATAPSDDLVSSIVTERQGQ